MSYELKYRDTNGNIEREVLTTKLALATAMGHARRNNATNVKWRRIRVDLWIVDSNGEAYPFPKAEKLSVRNAIRLAEEWLTQEGYRDTGIMILPSKRLMPATIEMKE